MRSYSLLAPAKINLYLEILGDRPDGFHELVMLLQSIDLCDRIDLHPNGTDAVRIYCQDPQVPLDQTNSAYQAAQVMFESYPETYANYGGIDITIEKNIPVAAGLAGGSCDAAAVLVGINLMWQLGLTQPELQILAARVGSDVPFCVSGGTAIATGRGEKLDPIPDLNNLAIVLAKYRSLSIAAAWAYQRYKQQFSESYVRDPDAILSRSAQVHSGPLVKAVIKKNGELIGQLLYNDLERVVLSAFPQVAHLRETLQSLGGLGTVMSGSGPTVFSLCETRAEAQQIQQQLRASIPDPDLEIWTAQLIGNGIAVA
ncbi:MAG: 4-(cytidine 5'-diphospho)-2-C-methyl-D-erythritol kinase [Cyanophyceae cyanobacterium]